MKQITILLLLSLFCFSANAFTSPVKIDPFSDVVPVNFYFPKNVYHFLLEDGMMEYYEDLKTYMAENEDKNILLVGYSDDGSNKEWNTRLSKYRARKVRDSLVKAGIPKARIQIDYKGKSDPIAKGDSAEELAKNRRVELRIK